VADERYDASCDATIALMRYGAGLPFMREYLGFFHFVCELTLALDAKKFWAGSNMAERSATSTYGD